MSNSNSQARIKRHLPLPFAPITKAFVLLGICKVSLTCAKSLRSAIRRDLVKWTHLLDQLCTQILLHPFEVLLARSLEDESGRAFRIRR